MTTRAETDMKEKPIIFSAPMIRAILEGRKSITRRILKPQPNVLNGGLPMNDGRGSYSVDGGWKRYAFAPGDLLWVREAFSYSWSVKDDPERRHLMPCWYWADGNPTHGDWSKPKPSIHMPRWASRITLKVTAVKVERLQQISEEDAVAEGIARIGREYIEAGIEEAFSNGPNFWNVEGMDFAGNWPTAPECFASLWYQINGDPKDQWEDTPFNAKCWKTNPWVAAIRFERVKP